MSFTERYSQLVIYSLGSLCLLFGIYYTSITHRNESAQLVQALMLAFLGFFSLFILLRKTNYRLLLFVFLLGLIGRLLFFPESPKLSDDYLRYLWDGKLVESGVDPFAYSPDSILQIKETWAKPLQEYDKLLHTKDFPQGMNSYRYYSVYPPVAQSLFYVSVVTVRSIEGSVLVMRTVDLCFEVATFFLLVSLLKRWGQNPLRVMLYWLNPLVMSEFIGNLHLEGIALFFILLTLLLIEKRHFVFSGIPMAMAIATKLNPLFLLGVGFRHINFKQLILFGGISMLLFALLFYPLTDISSLQNLYESLKLYKYWLEFNAGLYYLLLDMQKTFPDINIVGMYNYLLPLTLLIGFWLVNRYGEKYKLVERFVLIYLFYLLISRVVHPWYLIPLIGLAPLIKWKFASIWSFLVIFVYFSFDGGVYHEVKGYMLVEYVILYAILVVELFVLPQLKRS